MKIQTLLLSLVLAVPSLAAEATVRLLAAQPAAGVNEIVLVAEKKRSEVFPLPLNGLSTPLEAPARAFAVKAADGDAPLAQVALPTAGKSFIVLLIPAAEKTFTGVVLAADGKGFRPSDMYFHNSSARTVVGKVGTVAFTLEPGKGRVVRPAGALPEKLYEVAFHVRDEKGDRTISETRWPVDAQLRSYVFFFDKPGTDRVDYRAVEEFVAAPAGR